MNELQVIRTKATLTTVQSTGHKGLSGFFLILEEIDFRGERCYVLKDWDGENDEIHIVPRDAVHNPNDVEVVGWLPESGLDEWLTHPHLIPESRKS